MPFETTLFQPSAVSGVGLHSGAPANLRLLPAPPGTGIQFNRADLDGFVVEARSGNIAKVSYATSLMKKGVFISTTEHLLSALVGANVDNVVVEVDNLELPILDGSSLPFVELVDRAMVREQTRPRQYLRIKEKLELTDGERFIGIYPADCYKLHYRINFPHPLIGRQQLSLELTPENYRRELAPARTFGFLADFPAMRKQGLIRGGSMHSAVVLDEHRVLNGELRFPDEFVRHKMLDLIGDLALVGRQILGEVVADRAGHALHTALVKQLLADRSRWELVEQPTQEPAGAIAGAAPAKIRGRRHAIAQG